MRSSFVAIAFAAAVAAACAATGPLSGPAVAGAAAMLAVFDQLLASGAMDPAQHQALVDSVRELQRTVDAAQAGALTPEAAAGVAGGTTATVLALLRAYRAWQAKRHPTVAA